MNSSKMTSCIHDRHTRLPLRCRDSLCLLRCLPEALHHLFPIYPGNIQIFTSRTNVVLASSRDEDGINENEVILSSELAMIVVEQLTPCRRRQADQKRRIDEEEIGIHAYIMIALP